MTYLGLPIKLSIALSFQMKLSFLVSQVKLETLLLKNMERKFNLRFFEILLLMSHLYPLFDGMTRIHDCSLSFVMRQFILFMILFFSHGGIVLPRAQALHRENIRPVVEEALTAAKVSLQVHVW